MLLPGKLGVKEFNLTIFEQIFYFYQKKARSFID